VAVSLAALGLTAALFLDLHAALPPALGRVLLALQPGPALVGAVQGLAWAAVGLLLIGLATALWGRVFCSFLCPLGTYQDIVARVAAWCRGRPVRVHWAAASDGVRFGVLLAVAGTAAAGLLLPLALLDPFASFGRAAAALAHPVATAGNNLTAGALETAGVYALPRVESPGLGWPGLLAGAGALLLVGAMAARRGRLFCNTLCPVGTALGLVARIAPFRVRIDPSSCTHCGKCAIACKAGCIDLKTYAVDASRCVACFDCVPLCPEGGIGPWQPRTRVDPPVRLRAGVDLQRRALLGGAVTVLAAAAGPLARRVAALDRPGAGIACGAPVAPPGAGGVDRLARTCVACQLCVAACPTGVLRPAWLEYGASGLLRPRLDYRAAYCDYECVRCTEVCPTGALTRLAPPEKKALQLGRVRFLETLCVVVTDWTACGACAEHCPTGAVRMVPWEGDLTLPELDPEVCVGCGACEHACPVEPERAIRIGGHAVHARAEPPRETAAPPAPPPDFPF
jgi:ferredoxin